MPSIGMSDDSSRCGSTWYRFRRSGVSVDVYSEVICAQSKLLRYDDGSIYHNLTRSRTSQASLRQSRRYSPVESVALAAHVR